MPDLNELRHPGEVPSTSDKPIPSTPKTSEKPQTDSGDLNPILIWLCKSGPRWARIPATVGALVLTIGSPFFAWFHPALETKSAAVIVDKKSPDNATLDMAASAKATGEQVVLEHAISGDGVSPEDKEKAKAALKKIVHQMSHLTNPNEASVQWNVFGRTTPKDKDYFGYKVFPSDRCLLISRVENGVATAEWLTDPNKPQLDGAPAASHASAERPADPGVQPVMYVDGQPRISLGEAPVRLLSVSGGVPGGASPQGGMCLNPHPWAYQDIPGASIDGCQIPIFRRWADGCTLVQVINRCTNFAGPIVWQYCAPVHHP